MACGKCQRFWLFVIAAAAVMWLVAGKVKPQA